MLPAAQALITELDAETQITRRVLERLPGEHYDWRPHPKSLTAGRSRHHIATIPGNAARLTQLDGIDMATIHHRGELVVYLRLLGVPVPVVYGRSADENPFADS